MTAVKELKAVTCPTLTVHTDPSSRFLQLYICYRCILENVRGPEGSDLKRNLIQRMSEMTFDPREVRQTWIFSSLVWAVESTAQ